MESEQEIAGLSDAILCRPALPRDKTQALEFLKGVWEGRDYISLSPFSTAARILREPDRVS